MWTSPEKNWKTCTTSDNLLQSWGGNTPFYCMKLLTLEDYEKAGETFWPKYWYVAKELGDGARTEDILKAMEAVGNVALKLALDDKEGPFGFNKKEQPEDGF